MVRSGRLMGAPLNEIRTRLRVSDSSTLEAFLNAESSDPVEVHER